ncbi:hypothetical protein JOB18_045581 [Solea senegalensis]|uniref:Uncharacterized protein n=1 Tax=Solea senegalensis TaxID=28829 RepID=A0AAV6REE1_SOLSE|nr:hypothetical protein JOB18_045581 [Solea senegalensis]
MGGGGCRRDLTCSSACVQRINWTLSRDSGVVPPIGGNARRACPQWRRAFCLCDTITTTLSRWLGKFATFSNHNSLVQGQHHANSMHTVAPEHTSYSRVQ